MVRTYWLSFTDSDRPKGRQFLGVLVVDVTEADAAEALALRPTMHDQNEGPWIAAALRAAWKAGVNPGGEASSVRIDDEPAYAARYPRLTLLSRADIDALDQPPSADASDPHAPSTGNPIQRD